MDIIYENFIIKEENESSVLLIELGQKKDKAGNLVDKETILGYYGTTEHALWGLIRLLSSRNKNAVSIRVWLEEFKKIKQEVLNCTK